MGSDIRMLDYKTLKDILENEKSNEKKGIIFINEQQDEKYVTYKEVYNKALSVLGFIQDNGVKPGDELLLQIKENELFIYTIWACILGGFVAVPVPVAEKEEHKLRVHNIFRILKNPYIITSHNNIGDLHMDSGRNEDYANLENMVERSILLCKAFDYNTKAGTTTNGTPSDTVFVMFSSGSTGEPKGVMLTNETILTQIRTTNQYFEVNEEDKFLSWMPLTHTIGLNMFHLLPLASSVSHYIISMNLFIGNPCTWFELASKHRATILCSPNFGYKHLLDEFSVSKKYEWDLSCIKVLMNAAEPISKNLLDDFYTKMKPYQLNKKAISPSYGMTETCMNMSSKMVGKEYKWYSLNRTSVSVGDEIKEVDEEDLNSMLFVSVGNVVDCCEIRICGEDGERFKGGIIGNIEVIGKCVTSGYYNNQQCSEKAFTKDGWLITGDLGFIKDGELVITGRAKDIIISNGQNFYAYDIERVAQEINGVEVAAACSVFDEVSKKEAVVLFPQYLGDLKGFIGLSNKIKKHVSAKTGLKIKYVLPLDEIPKTGSGKIQRFKLKEMFLNGEFDKVKSQLEQIRLSNVVENITIPQNELEQKLVDIFSHVLGVETVGLDDDFLEYGGNSLNVLYVLTKLNAEGIHINTKYFLEHPTIRELSKVAKIEKENGREEEVVTGELPLLPNHALLDIRNLYGDVNHWNIGIMVEADPIPRKEQIEHVIAYLLSYHDGLRLRIYKEGMEWKQHMEGMPNQLPITYYDYSGMKEDKQKEEIERTAEELQQATSLSKMPVRFAVFYMGEMKPTRILTLIHHGIADGYAMSIFGQDMCTAFSMEMRGEKICLPQKTTSLKRWSEFLKEYAQTDEMRKEIDYWTVAAKNEVKSIPVDYPDQLNNNLFRYERVLGKYLLSKEKTEILFKKIIGRGIELNDIVLTAILRGLERWTGYKSLLIDYVFNGRYPFHDSINLSRTVGWINYFVPLYLDLSDKENGIQAFDYVKDKLHHIPNHGLGYGGLRYLCDDKEILEQMGKIPYPEITYNYFNAETIYDSFTEKKWGYIKPAKESAGENEGEYINRGRLIDFVIANKEEGLFCKLQYSCNIHKEETMSKLFYFVKEELECLFQELQSDLYNKKKRM